MLREKLQWTDLIAFMLIFAGAAVGLFGKHFTQRPEEPKPQHTAADESASSQSKD